MPGLRELAGNALNHFFFSASFHPCLVYPSTGKSGSLKTLPNNHKKCNKSCCFPFFANIKTLPLQKITTSLPFNPSGVPQ
jgi:hypothetical protein